MGFEDPVAEGAELTSLSNKQKAPIDESWSSASSASPWQPLELLKSEKKKEDSMGFDEPVYYAIKGSDPAGEANNGKVEVSAPKRFGSSGSMARAAGEEPADGNLQIAPLKANKLDSFAKKENSAPYSPVSSTGSSEHIFAAQQGGSPAIFAEKKAALEPLYTEKKTLAGESQSALKQSAFTAIPFNNESQFGLPSGSVEKVQMPKKFETGPATTQESNVAGGRGTNFFEQPVLKGLAVDQSLSSATFLPKADGQHIQQIQTFSKETVPFGERPIAPVEKLSIPSGSAQGSGPQYQLSKMGGTGSQTPFESQKGSPVAQVKSGQEIQTQIPAVPQMGFNVVQEKSLQTASAKAGGDVLDVETNRISRTSQPSFGGSTAFSKSEPIADNTRPVPRSSDMKVELAPQSKDLTARLAAPQDQSLIRKPEPGVTTGSSINNFAAVPKGAEDVAIRDKTTRFTPAPDSGLQSGLAQPALTQSSNGKRLVAETAPLAELPSKFTKIQPQFSQAEKYTADAQLRAQADRIATGAQMRAQESHLVASLKVKDSQSVAQIKPQENPLAAPTRQQDIQTGAKLKGEISTTSVRQNDQAIPLKTALQPQILENGLQPKLAQPKTQTAGSAETGMQPRVSPLTGKTQQDLVSALKPQDKPASRALTSESPVLADRKAADAATSADRRLSDATIGGDRRIAASTLKGNGDALGTPYTVDRGVRIGTAHIISGDIKVLTGKLMTNTNEVLPTEKRGASSAQIASLIGSVKEGKGDISRSFEQLMSAAVKNTGDRYVGGEFLLASMIIAAGAARRMPDRVAESQNQTLPVPDSQQSKRTETIKTGSMQAFQQLVESISKAVTPGKQSRAVEAALASNRQPGQSESVRYISGVELAVLLAAGGISKLRPTEDKGQPSLHNLDDTPVKAIRSAPPSTFNAGGKTLAAGADRSVSTPAPAGISSTHAEITAPFIPSPVPNTGAAAGGDKPNNRPIAEQTVRGERCIPGADVAIAAMLILGGAARKRTEERLPANPSDLAEKVDRPFRLDRRLGDLVAQAKSFVVKEPMPACGMRATAANIISAGEISVPHQYKQGAVKPLQDSGGRDVLNAPTGWTHEPVGRKEVYEEGSEIMIQASEQDQQSASGSNASRILYRPMWIIAPGETFVSIAEDHFADGSLAWLIADLNKGKFSDSIIEGKRVIEIQARQSIELPVASDIEEFRHNRMQYQEAENIITIVTASQLDIELKEATLKQFLGTVQKNLPIPAVAALPQLDLVQQPKPARTAAFGMSAPQFASIAAAVSLPLIIPHIDMVQRTSDTTAHIQEIRSENAKPEETV